MIGDNDEAAQIEAMRRFGEKAEELRQNFEERFRSILPGNHSPAEAVLLAHLMTASDGYDDVTFIYDWDKRRKFAYGTVFSYLPDLSRLQVRAIFALECIHGELARQLSIMIDFDSPGERLPIKIENENRLRSLGFRVLQFTELEILSDPEVCRERVEGILFEMRSDLFNEAETLRSS